MSATSSQSVHVGGINCTVYGLSSLSPPSPHGLTVLFVLHGRGGSAAAPMVVSWITPMLDYAQEQRKAGKEGKDLLVVAFDQRNHGERIVDSLGNESWEKNKGHAIDMYAIQTGTTRDVSFLIDFLPAVLFPNGERTVDTWAIEGISLGGHVSWLSLAQEPRIKFGIPIIGSPNYLTLMSHRAQSLPPPLGPLPITGPHFPASLLALIKKDDPVNADDRVWKGKRILVMSGKEDPLVNFVHGGSDVFVEKLKGMNGVEIEAFVEEGVGHACSPEMVRRASEFIWKYALSV